MILLNWCSSGFSVGDEAFNSSGYSIYPVGGGAGCFGDMSIAAGDQIQLGLWVSTADTYSGDVCFSAYDETNPNNGYVNCIAQPDPGATPASNYFEFGSQGGFFTGPMTEVIATASDCPSFGQLPEISYSLLRGAYVTHFTPWSDEWLPANGSACFSTVSTNQWTMGQGDNGTQIVDASSASPYGPRWEGFRNTSSFTPLGTWWTFDTDYELPTPVPDHSSMDVGQYGQVSFFESAEPEHIDTNSLYTGWTGSSGVLGGCSTGGPEQTLTCDSSANSGLVTVQFYMGEVDGYSLSSPVLRFLVYPDPSEAKVSLSSTTVDVLEPTTLTAVVTGGSGGFTYVWSGLPSGCTAQDAVNPTCAPTSAGTFNGISFTATDSNGFSAASPATSIQVDPALVFSPTTASATSGGVDVGQSVVFSATASGGSGTYSTYVWSGLPTGCAGSSTSSDSCTPAYSGTYSVSAQVTDSNGGTARSGALKFTVDSIVSVRIGASKNSSDVGQSDLVYTDASGGSGAYVYTWSGLPPGCAITATPSIACSPTEAGTFAVSAHVSDSNGLAVETPCFSYVVYSDPAITAVDAAPSTVDSGATTMFTVVVSGGRPPLTYEYQGLPPGCSSSNTSSLSCTPSAAGTYTAEVTVQDLNGVRSMKNVTLAVSTSALSSGGFEEAAILGTIAALAIAVVVLFVLILRRRPGRH
jgi:hypothetical protein